MNCPKCGKPMTKKADKGDGKGPNGGWLAVFEYYEGNCTEGYDFEIEMWQCPCGVTAYISEGN